MRPAQKRRIQQYGDKQKHVSPEEFLHNSLVHLEEYSEKHRQFWGEYLSSLAFEREKRIDDIKAALWNARKLNFSATALSRIVGGAYADNPLCTVGSTKEGGRFNFGGQASYLGAFNCLYVASQFETAYAEKYFLRESQTSVKTGLTGLDLQVKKPGTFAHLSLNVSVDSYLDIREIGGLQEFCDIISAIRPSSHNLLRAKSLKINLTTINSIQQLQSGLLEDNFKQWGTWVDHPSPSQWFGHYARAAGISGIVYPSLRSEDGFNLAIFPDTFSGTSCFVEIGDQQKIVAKGNTRMDGTNFRDFFLDSVGDVLLN